MQLSPISNSKKNAMDANGVGLLVEANKKLVQANKQLNQANKKLDQANEKLVQANKVLYQANDQAHRIERLERDLRDVERG